MTVQAQTPDGVMHEFPDGTPDSIVDGAIKNYLQPNIGTDPVRSAYQGTMNAVAKPINNAVNTVMGGVGQAETPAAQGVANAIDSTGAGQWVGDKMMGAENAVSGAIAPVVNNVKDLESYDPNLSKDLSAFGQNVELAGNIPVLKGVADAAALTGKGIKAAADIGANQAPNVSRNILANNTSARMALPPVRAYTEVQAANDALGDNTTAAYKKAHDLGLTLGPDEAQAMATQVRSDVGTLVPKASPQTSALLDAFDDEAESGLTLPYIDEYRKQLGRIAWNAANPNDVGKAQAAKQSIDSYLKTIQANPSLIGGGSPDSITALEEARTAHGLESNHDTLTEIGRQANGDPNVIQSKLKKLFDDKSEYYNFTDPADRQIISTLAHPESLNNVLEKIGKVGFGAGSKSLPAWGDAGTAAIALAMGNPLTAAGLAVPVVAGTAANVARGTIVRRAFDGLLKNLEERSVPVQPISPNAGAGNSGFSPTPSPKLFPAPPVRVNRSGVVQPPISASYSPPSTGAVAETGAIGSGTPPFPKDTGNTTMPKNIDASMTSQLTPAERMQVAGNVYQGAARRPLKLTINPPGGGAIDGPGGQQLKQMIGGDPIKSLQNIDPDAPAFVAKQSAIEARQAAQEKLAEEKRIRGSFKRGGAILTPAQIQQVNK